MMRLISKVRHLLQWIWQNYWIVLSFGTLVLVVISFVGPFHDLKFTDEKEYFQIARNVVDFGIYGYDPSQPTPYRAPGYTFFIAAFLRAGLGKDTVNIAQILLWAFNGFLTAKICLKLSGQAAAGAALVFSLLYPLFGYAALRAYPQTLTATLLLVILYLFFFRSPTANYSVKILGVGITAGLSVLTTPPMALILAGIAAVALVLQLASLRSVLTAAAIACVLTMPWLARNWILFDRAILATTGGMSLLQGNSENARPDISNPDISRYTDATKDFDDIRSNDYFAKAALNWIKNNPRSAAELYIKKLLQFFNYREKYATSKTGGGLAESILFAAYYPLLILALSNLIFARRWKVSREEVLLFVTYLGAAAFYAAFLVRLRYRIPFDTIVVTLAAIALGRIVGEDTQRSLQVRVNNELRN
jgi:4-amino-4-deoxy-L-arabinose transferase-like glycosyltransferase